MGELQELKGHIVAYSNNGGRGQLSSRRRPNDFSTGQFQFRMLSDGNVELNTINLPTQEVYDAYYVSDTRDEQNISNYGHQVVYDKSGYLYILKNCGDKSDITSPRDVGAFPASAYYHKANLNFDGVLTLSYLSKSSTSANATWTKIEAMPSNFCVDVDGDLVTGPCRYNSICTLKEDQRPSCKCPVGYSLLDPNDEYGGCKPEFLPLCNGNLLGDRVELQPLPNTDWPTSDYELLKPYNVEDCKKSCLLDCLCAVEFYNSQLDKCWKKKLPLSNGREVTTLSTMVFFKLSNVSTKVNPPDPKILTKKEQNNVLLIVISVLLGSSVFVNFILVSAMCLEYFNNYRKKYHHTMRANKSIVESNLHRFTYEELAEATINLEKSWEGGLVA